MPKGELVCPACVKKLSPVAEPVCRRCGKEVTGERIEYCFTCTKRPRSFEEGRALLNYNEAAKTSVTAVKYHNKREYLDFYAAAMTKRFEDKIRRWNPDCLIPVPVHWTRRCTRGFNQAEELADRLSEVWRIPVNRSLLVRTRKTLPQKKLNPEERLKNLQKAFAVSLRGTEPVPESAVLIDDIYTTGSTLEACTQALKGAGVKRVYFLTICITGGR